MFDYLICNTIETSLWQIGSRTREMIVCKVAGIRMIFSYQLIATIAVVVAPAVRLQWFAVLCIHPMLLYLEKENSQKGKPKIEYSMHTAQHTHNGSSQQIGSVVVVFGLVLISWAPSTPWLMRLYIFSHIFLHSFVSSRSTACNNNKQ